MPEAVCALAACGKQITVRPSRIGTPRFCSHSHAMLARSADPEARARSRAARDRRYMESHKDVLREKLKKWRATNPEKARAQHKRHRVAHAADRNAHYRAWREKNLEREIQRSREYQRRNRPRWAAYQRAKEAKKLKATPVWADKSAIRRIYEEANRLGMQVDHIVPLLSDRVCGLHWEGNLQLLTAKENAAKKNYWWPHMPERQAA